MAQKMKIKMNSNGRNSGSMIVSIRNPILRTMFSKDLNIVIPFNFEFEIPECECCEEMEQNTIQKPFSRYKITRLMTPQERLNQARKVQSSKQRKPRIKPFQLGKNQLK